jgi:hypothetical protein
MQVKIDQSENYSVSENAQDALAALEEISNYLHAGGRAAIKFMLGGKSISTEKIESFRGKPVSALEGLRIETAQLSALVAEALDELEKTTPELAAACHRLAEVFQGEAPEQGYEPFQQIAEIWRVIKEREMQVAMALEVDWTVLTVGDTPIVRLHDELNDYLAEAAEALKVEDCVLLGDLLEYELAPKAEMEPEIVAILRDKANQVLQK